MRWYWVVSCDNTVDDPLVTDEASLLGLDESSFMQGKKIEQWTTGAYFRATDAAYDGEPDDVLQEHLGIPVYSARLQSALAGAGITGIQFLPVDIVRANGGVVSGFAIANVLDLVPALDPQKSDYDIFPNDYFIEDRRGRVRGIRRAVLLKAAVQSKDIVRLYEFPHGLYVSERFKQAFEAGHHTGYSFHEVAMSDAA